MLFVVNYCFYVLNVCKNRKKCKKMQKNAKKCEKICIYQKIVVILHRQIKNDTQETKLETQKQQENEQDVFNKKLRRDFTDHSNNQSQFPY